MNKPGAVAWLVLGVLGGALLFVLITHPIGTLATVAAIALLGVLGDRGRLKRLRAMQYDRVHEDIGSFARACRRYRSAAVDPWAIRAVWDAFTPYTEVDGQCIPLRPTDRFVADLGIDMEDVEDEVTRLVERCERVGGNWQANPFYQGLSTVGDLVYFISAQPLRRSA